MINMKIKTTITTLFALATVSAAGIYSGPTGTTANLYDTPISKTDDSIVAWATEVVSYNPTSGVSTTYQNPETGYGSLGDLTAEQVDSGIEPGSIVLSFENGITNGDGKDFAVFENGFAYGTNSIFMELAYVEVSTDGVNYVRFDSISLNTSPTTGSGAFSGWDCTNVYNLAGKNQSGWGTTFDLDELTGKEEVLNGLVDLNNIQYVRLVDIPGTGQYLDSLGNPIYDAWLTTGSGGYDFRLSEGIAVINEVPEPATIILMSMGAFAAARRRNNNN